MSLVGLSLHGLSLSWALPATAALAAAQAGIMLVDEVYYHRRRRLGRFEALGHPADTAAFLAAILVPALRAPTPGNLALFAALGVFSTLLITKDEFIHARSCEPGEQWLHALLFVLHAPILIGIAAIWYDRPDAAFLRLLPAAVGAWGIYQFSYWVGEAWRPSTTRFTTSSGSAGTRTTDIPSPSSGPNPG